MITGALIGPSRAGKNRSRPVEVVAKDAAALITDLLTCPIRLERPRGGTGA